MFQANAFQPNAFQHNAETQIIPPTPPEVGSWGGGYIDPLVLKDKRKRKKLHDHLDALRRANAEDIQNLHSELLRAYRGENSAMDVVDVAPDESFGDDETAVSVKPRASDEVLRNISATLRKPLHAAKASVVVIGGDVDDDEEDDIEILLLYH